MLLDLLAQQGQRDAVLRLGSGLSRAKGEEETTFWGVSALTPVRPPSEGAG